MSKLLVPIILLATVLRIWALDSHISAAYGDEAAIAYNAHSILQTGQDEFGVWLPLQFESWGDQKNPVYIYTVSLFQIVFGMNLWSTRLPSAFSGVLAVWLTYLLALQLFSKPKPQLIAQPIALLSALLLALNPWHLHLSRGGYEANMALTLGLAAAYFFLKSSAPQWDRNKTLSLICAILAVYTYYTTKMFIPLFIIMLMIWQLTPRLSQWRQYLKPYAIYLVLFILASLPFVYLALFQGGQARFSSINVFANPQVAARVNTERSYWQGPPLLGQLLINKPVIWARDITQHLAQNLSPVYYFTQGDNSLRYTIGDHGVFYFIEWPFMLLGLLYLFSSHRRLFALLVAWLLLAILPTTLVGQSYALRSLASLPIPQILIAAGLVYFYLLIHNNSAMRRLSVLAVAAIVLLYGLSVSNFLLRYAYAYPTYGHYWYDGAVKDIIDYAIQNQSKYSQIYLTRYHGKTELYFAYYQNIPARDYQTATQDAQISTKLGKYIFTDQYPALDPNALIIAAPNYPDGLPLFAKDDGRIIAKIVEK